LKTENVLRNIYKRFFHFFVTFSTFLTFFFISPVFTSTTLATSR